MTPRALREYFRVGAVFLREHPQLLLTGFVGIVICGAFLLTSFLFITIARDAQQQLWNDRSGWLLDGIVLFVSDDTASPQVLEQHFADVMAQNHTLHELAVLVQVDRDTWQVVASGVGSTTGTIIKPDSFLGALYRSATADPRSAYSMPRGSGLDRHWITARAVADASGLARAIVVSDTSLSESDAQIERRIVQSVGILILVLFVLLVLFVRHARLIDYAVLYRKQLEVDQMKDSFLSMASHELKTPLTIIRGYVEYLQQDNLDQATRNEFLRRVDLSATELRQLVDDILDVSRIEMGRLRFSPDLVCTAELLREVCDMFQMPARGKGLTLTLDTGGTDSVTIRADKARSKQVLVNLVSNAIKYTVHGQVTVKQEVMDGRVTIAVRDSGIGMTADEQKRLFEKFYRVEAVEAKNVTGTGLGLWITKYMIDHMGGSISVESIKGEGSRFVVSFPVQQSVVAAS